MGTSRSSQKAKGWILGSCLIGLWLAGHVQGKPTPTPDPKGEMNSGLVYGDDHAFWITAPKGWVLDNQSGVSQGLYAVFYPKGSSWEKGKVVMYANTTHKDKGQETLQKMIDHDLTEYRDERKTKKIVDSDPIPTGDKGKKAVVKYFLNDLNGNYEACAYIDESKIVVFLVLTARSEEGFRENLSAFKQLVASYSFFTDKVTQEKDGAQIGQKGR